MVCSELSCSCYCVECGEPVGEPCDPSGFALCEACAHDQVDQVDQVEVRADAAASDLWDAWSE